jgi:urease subunit gamma/beta
MHLDIPAGDAVRWQPGEVQRIRLVAYGGRGVIRGFNGLTDGPASPERLAEGLERARLGGYGQRPAAAQETRHGQ